MTYTLRLLTEEARDLVVDAMRAEAGKRTRVASRAALEVAQDRAAKRDVRSASVKVTALLAEAALLEQLAGELAAAEDVPLVAPNVAAYVAAVDAKAEAAIAAADAALTPVEEHIIEATADGTLDDLDEQLAEEQGDDGLSPAAHAAMAQADEFAEAYLADEDGPDVDTGAIGEDEPDTDDVEEALK